MGNNKQNLSKIEKDILMENIKNDFLWTLNVINSCETAEQIEASKNIVDNMSNKYSSYIYKAKDDVDCVFCFSNKEDNKISIIDLLNQFLRERISYVRSKQL